MAYIHNKIGQTNVPFIFKLVKNGIIFYINQFQIQTKKE